MSLPPLTAPQVAILQALKGGALGYFRDDVCVLMFMRFAEQDIDAGDVLVLEQAGLLVGGSMFEISDAGVVALAEWNANAAAAQTPL
ncbi:MAG: hypothetical protein JWQ08_947 [Deinococcus sp.]|nr:hypothetical protein [Deinococcus sp.]